MDEQAAIKVFEEKQVRTVWDGEQEKRYFSVVDVIAKLTPVGHASIGTT